MLKNSKLGLMAYDNARLIRSACMHANGAVESELPELGFLSTEKAAVSRWFKHETTTLALRCLNKMRRENRIAELKAAINKAGHFLGFGEEALSQYWKAQAQAEGIYGGSCVELSQSQLSSEMAEASG